MSRHCTLHIGTEKTGTTSLQVRLARARSELDAQRVRYCASLGSPSHRSLAVFAMGFAPNDDGFQALEISTPQDHARFGQALKKAFAAEVAEFAGAERWIISSEHLHSRLRRLEQVQKVRSFLAPHFDHVTIYLHLRPQIDMAVSLASTAARVGTAVTPNFFSSVSPQNGYYDHLSLFRTWSEVFGEENLRCVAFGREPDMLERLKVDLDLRLSGEGAVGHLNKALDVRVIAMVAAVTQSGMGTRIPMAILDQMPLRERLSPGRAFAQEVQARFDADNARLIAQCPDLQSGDLTPDWPCYTEAGNLDLLTQPCAFGAELAQLIGLYNAALEQPRPKR